MTQYNQWVDQTRYEHEQWAQSEKINATPSSKFMKFCSKFIKIDQILMNLSINFIFFELLFVSGGTRRSRVMILPPRVVESPKARVRWFEKNQANLVSKRQNFA